MHIGDREKSHGSAIFLVVCKKLIIRLQGILAVQDE